MSKLVPGFADFLKGMPAGSWVAISQKNNLTLAFGADPRDVLREARGKGERLPLMVRV